MKLSKKILSVVLAVLMAFSTFAVTLSASAAEEPVKPEYTENVTQEDVSLMLDDAQTLLGGVLNGSFVEGVYKFLPGMNALMSGVNTVARYSDNYDFFADLASYSDDGTKIVNDSTDEEGNPVPGTFSKFFADHPIVCNSMEDVQKELDTVIDIMFKNFGGITLLNIFDSKKTAIPLIQGGFDKICQGLGIAQEMNAADMGAVADTVSANGSQYSKNIVAAIFPEVVNNVVGVLQKVVSVENGPMIYSGIKDVMTGLNQIANNSMLSSYLGSMKQTLLDVTNTFLSLPTIDKDSETERLDLEGIIPTVLDMVGGAIGENLSVTFDDALFEESYDNAGHAKPEGGKTVALIFKPMADDLAKVAAAEAPADAVKFVFDYIYDNLLVNKYNNKKLYNVIDNDLIELPPDVKTTLLNVLDPADDDQTNVPKSADEVGRMLVSLVGEQVDHHINLEAVAQQELTCVQDGIAEDCYYCPDCKNYFAKADYPTIEEAAYAAKDKALDKAALITAATGHEFGDVVAAKEPTLYEEGNVEYKPCTKCSKNFAPDAEKMAADDTAIDVTIAKLEGTLGDIDNDGKINAKDVLMVKKHIAQFEGEALDEVQFALADVNADEKVNAQDVLLIMQYIAQIIDSFPAEAEPAPVEPAPAPAE